MRDKIQKTIYKSFIVLGSILIIYYLALKVAFGVVAFSNMFCLLGIILLSYGTIELKYKLDIWGKLPKATKGIVTLVFLIGITVFISIEAIIFYNGHHYDKEKPDYLVVLGAGLRGSSISASLQYRLDTAIEFNELYPDVKIVVSGGQGEGEDITEASAMKKYLVEKGISKDLIISEDKSTNTYENFLFTKEILEKESNKDDITVTVVSNNFHMYRAKFLGKEIGLNCLGYPAPAHKGTSLVFHVREFFGVIKAYIFKR